jgi:signal peptidase I
MKLLHDARHAFSGRRRRGGSVQAEAVALKKQTLGQKFLSALKEIAIIVVFALVASFVIKTFLFRAFYIPSGSMESTLNVGDRVFVNLFVPRNTPLQRGDIVVFKDTQNWLQAKNTKAPNALEDVAIFVGLSADNSSQYLIKRVIGLPGDHVVCCDTTNRLMINDMPIDEPYLKAGSNNAAGPNSALFDVVVPTGKMWVMGDNRNDSSDSRFHTDLLGRGFVDLTAAQGTAVIKAWPLSDLEILSGSSEVFRDVPKPKLFQARASNFEIPTLK